MDTRRSVAKALMEAYADYEKQKALATANASNSPTQSRPQTPSSSAIRTLPLKSFTQKEEINQSKESMEAEKGLY